MHILLVVIFSLPVAISDEIKLGICPEVAVTEDFDYQKMLGKWFVIQKTGSASSCVTMDFKEDPKEGMMVEESLKPLGLSIPKYMERFSQVGMLRVPSRNFPAKMKVTFPFSMIPYTEVDFWVMDTDYTTYAAIWSCRPLVVGHRQLAMILSRRNVLDQTITNKLREKFEFHNVDPHSLSIINHKNCESTVSNKDNPGSGTRIPHIVTTIPIQITTQNDEPDETQPPDD